MPVHKIMPTKPNHMRIDADALITYLFVEPMSDL